LGERGSFAVSSGLALTAKNEQRKIRQMGAYFIERTFKKYGNCGVGNKKGFNDYIEAFGAEIRHRAR
jgi:hypothetical protein